MQNCFNGKVRGAVQINTITAKKWRLLSNGVLCELWTLHLAIQILTEYSRHHTNCYINFMCGVQSTDTEKKWCYHSLGEFQIQVLNFGLYMLLSSDEITLISTDSHISGFYSLDVTIPISSASNYTYIVKRHLSIAFILLTWTPKHR